ncbi:ABC transporter permease [Rapidithrix thailandica]|uniref:ABC transporter permease n=1 Tax=Rapidithrix thailandica TaxID=413964 RepID=A0AAW9S3A2_9BACT
MNTARQTHHPLISLGKQLFKRKSAFWGLLIIAMAYLLVILGYSIIPDTTPNANDGAVEIAQKPPLFRVQLLKVHKNLPPQKSGFLERLYWGEESSYLIIPLSRPPQIKGDSVYYQPYPGQKTEAKLLLACVKALYTGDRNFSGFPAAKRFHISKDSIQYINAQQQGQSITREALIREFWQHNLEERMYVLGTDKSGRDVFSRLLFGTRISLGIGFIAVFIALLIGISLGAIAGYFGGLLDALIMWLMTVNWSIPTIMMVMVISVIFHSHGIWVIFLAVGLTMWVEIARVVRGQFISLKQQAFIEATHALGLSDWRIIYHHILPNTLPALIVISTSNFATAILIEAGLSFLDLGVAPPMPSWGGMVSEGYQLLLSQNSWHLIVFPAACICTLVLAFNLLGNGLRDAFDPQNP